jgi:sirohydrochlorin ferrochelatase
MSTAAAALTVAAVLAVSLPAAWWQIRRAARHPSERDRLIRAAHQQAEAARLSDPITLAEPDATRRYLERIEAGDPELNARLDRLRHELAVHPNDDSRWDRRNHGIHDEQQKGETA